MGELDFEISPDRQRRQQQTEIHREKQLSPAPAFVSLCRLLSVALSQFLHNFRPAVLSGLIIPKRLMVSTRVDQAQFSERTRVQSLTCFLTSNQVPRDKFLRLQGFFATVQRLCK
jgi:hypothetical protein